MWLLKKITEDGVLLYLTSSKKSYTIGRKNCDIVLQDNSISRTHCIINIAPRKECPFPVQTLSGAWVVDKKSKYGTFIGKDYQWVQLEGEKIEQLENDSVIRFGLMENIWKIEYKPVIVCTSRLTNEQTQGLKSLVAEVGGKLLGKWMNQCSILIVNDITLTAKVLLALINGVPIVTRNFLPQLVENIKQNLPWPDYKQYRPEIKESTLVSHLVSLDIEHNRKELFKGKKFVIPREEQLESLKEIILAAGGEAEILKFDGNWRKLAKENTIVLQLPCNNIINPDQNANSFINLANVLKNEYHVRVVPETEIFQAIAYSSIEKYCNPKSTEFEVRHSENGQNSYGDILEEETPSQFSQVRASPVRQRPTRSVSAGFPAPSTSGVTRGKKEIPLCGKRNRSPEKERTWKKAAVDTTKISKRGVQSPKPSPANDDLFWVESPSEDGDKYQSKPVAPAKDCRSKPVDKKVFTDNTNAVRPETSNVSTDQEIPKETEVPKSSENLQDDELDDFWKLPTEIANKPETEKRKLREGSAEKTESNPTPKKRRTTVEEEKEVVLPVVNEIENNPPIVRLENESEKEKPKVQLPAERRRIVLPCDSGSGWIRRKNADTNYTREDYENDLDPSKRVSVCYKRFKKNPVYKCEPKEISEEEYEEIGKKLLAAGWAQSRAYRLRKKEGSS